MKFYFSTILILVLSLCAFAQTERDQGIALYMKGDYAGAVSLLEKAIESDAGDRDSWLFLGMSRARTEDKKNARKVFDKAKSIRANGLSYFEQEVKITFKPRPSYTDQARSNQISGVVKLAVEFGADGKINFIYPVQSLPDGLTRNSIEAATKIKFEPARKNGEAATAIRIVDYTFEIF